MIKFIYFKQRLYYRERKIDTKKGEKRHGKKSV